MTFNRTQAWISLIKQSETDLMKVAWGPDIRYCAYCPALWSPTDIFKRIITGSCTTAAFHRRTGSPWAHVTYAKGSQGEAKKNVMLPVTSLNMTSFLVGQWQSGEAYRTDLYWLGKAAWLSSSIKMKTLDPLSDHVLVLGFLGSSWCPTMPSFM